jgi:hypothetical protein
MISKRFDLISLSQASHSSDLVRITKPDKGRKPAPYQG